MGRTGNEGRRSAAGHRPRQRGGVCQDVCMPSCPCRSGHRKLAKRSRRNYKTSPANTERSVMETERPAAAVDPLPSKSSLTTSKKPSGGKSLARKDYSTRCWGAPWRSPPSKGGGSSDPPRMWRTTAEAIRLIKLTHQTQIS